MGEDFPCSRPTLRNPPQGGLQYARIAALLFALCCVLGRDWSIGSSPRLQSTSTPTLGVSSVCCLSLLLVSPFLVLCCRNKVGTKEHTSLWTPQRAHDMQQVVFSNVRIRRYMIRLNQIDMIHGTHFFKRNEAHILKRGLVAAVMNLFWFEVFSCALLWQSDRSRLRCNHGTYY